jgi:integration host factor subunit alpha
VPLSDHALTRADLADAVNRMVGLSRNESGQLVETVLNLMTSALEAGETVKISSFGTWIVREKAARQGRNPKTKEPATIAPRRVIVFRPSQILKKTTNGEKISTADKEKWGEKDK